MKYYYKVKTNEYKGFSYGVKPTLEECTAGATCYDVDTDLTWTIDAEGVWSTDDKGYAPLPEISTSDNGKLLSADGGNWVLTNAPSSSGRDFLIDATTTDNVVSYVLTEGEFDALWGKVTDGQMIDGVLADWGDPTGYSEGVASICDIKRIERATAVCNAEEEPDYITMVFGEPSLELHSDGSVTELANEDEHDLL